MVLISFCRKFFLVEIFPIFCSCLFFSIISTSVSEAKVTAANEAFDPVALQLKWKHQFQFAGFYAAIEKGFYQEVGLDVTLIEGRPGIDFIETVVSGKAEYGIEMPDLLLRRAAGEPVVVLASIYQHSPIALISLAESNIRTPHDLIGRKIMLRPESNADLRAMIAHEGIGPDSIEIADHSFNLEDLLQGKTDAMSLYSTAYAAELKSRGIAFSSLFPHSYGVDFYGDCLFTSEDEINKHPDRVRAFRAASLKGWEYAMDNPEELAQLIHQKYSPHKSVEVLLSEAEQMAPLLLHHVIKIGHTNPGRWEHIKDIFTSQGMIDSDFSLEGLIYDPNPGYDHKKMRRFVFILVSAVAIIIIISIILLIYNRKLNSEVLKRTQNLSSEIAERKLVEKSLSESEEKFKALADTSPLAIYMSEGIEQKAEYINPTFTKLFGYTIDEVPSVNHWWPLAYPDANNRKQISEEWQKKVAHAIETKSTIEPMEVMVTCKDGSKKNISWGFITTGKQNWACGLDLTEQKRAEKERVTLESQLRQAHKMEAIGTLAGGIAHDFNNILAAILGYADMAMDDTPDHSPAKYQIEQVLKAGNRAKDLVKHILFFSRKETQKRIPVPIHEIVTDALKLLRASIPTTIEIKENIDSSCGNILADPTQIHQVMMNLCTNAAQSMDKNGGILEVELNTVQLNETDLINQPHLNPGYYVRLTIKDSGIGIDPEYIDRIFDPYFTTKEVGKGSGMGLAVVLGIVKNYGGMIKVDNKHGMGTAFNVYFPRIEEQIQEKPVDTTPLPRGSERILIVDDEKSIVDMTRQRVERLGYQVTTKTSSLEALELFRSQPGAFDLVITDQTMPELTGEKLSKKILEIKPDIPIIICTGYSLKIDAEKADLIGISAFIMKPTDKKELAKTIRKVLDA